MMLETLWVVSLILGALLFIVSLFMMLYWKVFSLIDELSGRKAKRQIAKLRSYSSSTDIISVDTKDLGVISSEDDLLLKETNIDISPNERSLKNMIDDPYGSVGKGAVKSSATTHPKKKMVDVQPDEGETGILEDIPVYSNVYKRIVIIDEQSSI